MIWLTYRACLPASLAVRTRLRPAQSATSPTLNAESSIVRKQQKIRITDLLYPHWPAITLAFVAVIGESLTDLLEPWPLKIVFDYIFGSKRMPVWLAGAVSFIGTDKLSILDFAVLAVIVIAIFGALSSYLEKYLTTSVGQWVMHDLRRVLYSHIQKLSLSYHDQKRTGDLISTVTSDIDAVQGLISQ